MYSFHERGWNSQSYSVKLQNSAHCSRTSLSLAAINAAAALLQPWTKVTFSATKACSFVLYQQWSANQKYSTIVFSIED
jgi:hypothetical protein